MLCGVNSLSAREVAVGELNHLDRRLKHVTGVADLAASVQVKLPDRERDVLAAAAWLHGIGYAKRLALTGVRGSPTSGFFGCTSCPTSAATR